MPFVTQWIDLECHKYTVSQCYTFFAMLYLTYCHQHKFQNWSFEKIYSIHMIKQKRHHFDILGIYSQTYFMHDMYFVRAVIIMLFKKWNILITISHIFIFIVSENKLTWKYFELFWNVPKLRHNNCNLLITDGLVLIQCQDICNNHDDINQSSICG